MSVLQASSLLSAILAWTSRWQLNRDSKDFKEWVFNSVSLWNHHLNNVDQLRYFFVHYYNIPSYSQDFSVYSQYSRDVPVSWLWGRLICSDRPLLSNSSESLHYLSFYIFVTISWIQFSSMNLSFGGEISLYIFFFCLRVWEREVLWACFWWCEWLFLSTLFKNGLSCTRKMTTRR